MRRHNSGRRWLAASMTVGVAVLACGTPVFAGTLPITEFPLSAATAQPLTIVTGPDGNVWFTEQAPNKIGRLTPTGTLAEFPVPTANSYPYGIAMGPDGNVWFAEYAANKIGQITPAGIITEFPVPTASSGPTGIARGGDGNLWFTEKLANKIGRVEFGGIVEFAIPTTNSAPWWIAAGPDGNLWFTEASGSQIGRITPSGVFAEFVVPTANGAPFGITAGPDGNMWFTELDANRIGRTTPGGTITEFVLPAANSIPSQIVAGPDGNLWFTEQAGKIGRITTTGRIGEFPVPTMNADPFGMTAGPDGNLWFTELNSGKIGRVTLPPGAVLQYGDGSVGVWYLGGPLGDQPRLFTGLSGPLAGWTPVDLVDLNGDHSPDVILRYSDGSLGVWLLGGPQGSQILATAILSGPLQGWTPVGLADLNGDGHPDLILQYSDGTIAVTYLGGAQGTQPLSFVVISAPLGAWRVVGAADLDGDGHPDLVMQYPNGELAVTYLGGAQGAQPLSFVVISGPVVGWSVVGLTDLDGDGHPDLISRYADGSVGVTYLGGAKGSQPLAFALMAGPLPAWQEAFPH